MLWPIFPTLRGKMDRPMGKTNQGVAGQNDDIRCQILVA